MRKLILLFLCIFIVGCSRNSYVDYNMFYMDSYIEVKVYGLSNKDKDLVFDNINNIYKEYHQLCDRYNEYEGVINIYYLNNKLDNNVSINIDNKLNDILLYSLNAYRLTSGKVNIAIGNAIDMWNFYKDSGNGIPNKEDMLNLKSVSIEDIKLDNGIYIKYNDVKLDLGAICKGYVTELVGNELENLGYPKYLINAGGNIKVGNHYSNSKYKIGIEDPTENLLVYKIINGNNISVVTSGGYERFYTYNNERYHHIIDPITLYSPNYSQSVSVITKDSSLGDVLSTYLFLIPIEEGLEFVNSNNDIEAVWYGLDNDIYKSKGINRYE